MCVLTGNEIKRHRDSIFSRQSWSNECFQEVSYDLRIDTEPYLRVSGKVYEPEAPYKGTQITIRPGDLALLPTVESFNMPQDLAGDIKIKFSHTGRGLTPLFSSKVDPYFGRGHSDERLYLWVSNLGATPITLSRGERVFTIQFHKLVGEAPTFEKKDAVGPRVAKEAYAMGVQSSLGIFDELEDRITKKVGGRVDRVERGSWGVLFFGMFLVLAALVAGGILIMFD